MDKQRCTHTKHTRECVEKGKNGIKKIARFDIKHVFNPKKKILILFQAGCFVSLFRKKKKINQYDECEIE